MPSARISFFLALEKKKICLLGDPELQILNIFCWVELGPSQIGIPIKICFPIWDWKSNSKFRLLKSNRDQIGFQYPSLGFPAFLIGIAQNLGGPSNPIQTQFQVGTGARAQQVLRSSDIREWKNFWIFRYKGGLKLTEVLKRPKSSTKLVDKPEIFLNHFLLWRLAKTLT